MKDAQTRWQHTPTEPRPREPQLDCTHKSRLHTLQLAAASLHSRQQVNRATSRATSHRNPWVTTQCESRADVLPITNRPSTTTRQRGFGCCSCYMSAPPGSLQKIGGYSACKNCVENYQASRLKGPCTHHGRASPPQVHCRTSSCISPAGKLQKTVGHTACRDKQENRRSFRLRNVGRSACRDTTENRRAFRQRGHCRISSCNRHSQ